MGRATRLRWIALRTAWLLIGAAIGLATVLVVYGLTELVQPSDGSPRPLVVAGCIVPALLIGLLPGVRELEVTAAHSLLDAGGDLVAPTKPRAEHRWRTMVMVTFHLGVGLLAGVLLLAVLPGWLRVSVGLASGGEEDYRVLGVHLPAVSSPVALVLGLGGAVLTLVAVWGLGRLAVFLAPRLLGATARDQLEVALVRLEAESEHTRLARDLHDGIGHALTIISVQAAGGRKRLDSDPGQVDESLATIEVTARQALTELDDMLGLLRDRDSSGAPAPDLAQLADLVAAHRSAGMDIRDEIDPVATLPRLVSTMAYRIVAEALTNAQRHGVPGPVALAVRHRQGWVSIDAHNPTAAERHAGRGSGHGLQGIVERVALFGGTVQAGPTDDGWRLHAEIPIGGPR